MDQWDVATKLNKIAKQTKYGKIDISFDISKGLFISGTQTQTHKILVHKEGNFALSLIEKIHEIISQSSDQIIDTKFIVKNGKISKIIIKNNTDI